MLRDYCPNKKTKKVSQSADAKKSFKFNPKFLAIFVLVTVASFLLFMIVKTEFGKFYRLKENQRVLLLKNQQPVAYLSFNVNNKQITVTDLRQSNFDFGDLNQEASLAGELNKNLFYAFLLDTVFDQSYEYTQAELGKEDLLSFFNDKKVYRYFLKDRELLWREQKFTKSNFTVVEPIFNCPVALINTTAESGLANSLASMLEKSSFSIIKKDSNTDNLEQTKIFYNPSEKSCEKLLDKLDRIFPPSLLSVSEEETLNHRAAMVIYVGKDLANLYNFFLSKNLQLQ